MTLTSPPPFPQMRFLYGKPRDSKHTPTFSIEHSNFHEKKLPSPETQQKESSYEELTLLGVLYWPTFKYKTMQSIRTTFKSNENNPKSTH